MRALPKNRKGLLRAGILLALGTLGGLVPWACGSKDNPTTPPPAPTATFTSVPCENSSQTPCTSTPTFTPTATNTPTPTPTLTVTSTPSSTATNSQTSTPTNTATATATSIHTFTYITSFNGSADATNGIFNYPLGVALDSSDNLYVTDTNHNLVRVFNSSLASVTAWGGLGTGNGAFSSPIGIAVDKANSLVYVCDRTNNRIQKFKTDGTWQATFYTYNGGVSYLRPDSIAVDGSGNVYIGDDTDVIVKLDSTGVYQTSWGSTGTGTGQFQNPYGTAISPGGTPYVYITDLSNNNIQKFTTAGTYQSQFGTFGNTNGTFNGASGIAFDSGGSIYVTDINNFRVEQFDSNGNYLTQFGGFGTTGGKFYYPGSVAVDSLGNVYVTDRDNNRVEKFN